VACTKCTLLNREGTLVEGLGLLIFALVSIEISNTLANKSGIGMLGVKRVLTDCEYTLVERSRLLIFEHSFIEKGKTLENISNIGMLRTKYSLLDCERTAVAFFGSVIFV
jgi:hypothetical protein